jgi:pyruvate dehydrogenase E2 component (dihydrolipoamide acetyltransferase)
MIDVTLPHIADGVDKASVSYLHHKAGDNIRNGEDLIELVTDKASFNLPSPVTGILKEVLVNEGDTVKVGQVLVRIEG